MATKWKLECCRDAAPHPQPIDTPWKIPTRELTYPTWGIGNSSSNVPCKMVYVSFQEDTPLKIHEDTPIWCNPWFLRHLDICITSFSTGVWPDCWTINGRYQKINRHWDIWYMIYIYIIPYKCDIFLVLIIRGQHPIPSKPSFSPINSWQAEPAEASPPDFHLRSLPFPFRFTFLDVSRQVGKAWHWRGWWWWWWWWLFPIGIKKWISPVWTNQPLSQ